MPMNIFVARSLAVLVTFVPWPAAAATMQMAQVAPNDSYRTLVQPQAPDAGRAGQIQQLPGGGVGVTTGGTSHYQTLATPGGSGIAVPNGNGTSSVLGSAGQAGTTMTPR